MSRACTSDHALDRLAGARFVLIFRGQGCPSSTTSTAVLNTLSSRYKPEYTSKAVLTFNTYTMDSEDKVLTIFLQRKRLGGSLSGTVSVATFVIEQVEVHIEGKDVDVVFAAFRGILNVLDGALTSLARWLIRMLNPAGLLVQPLGSAKKLSLLAK